MDLNLRGLALGKHRLPCPECGKGPKDDAMAVELRADGSAVWWCWRCHASGGARGDRVLTMHAGSRPKGPAPHDQDRQRSALAACRVIWKQTQPLAGTLGEQYLRLRQCALPPADGDLRFHEALFCPEVAMALSALVARVTTVSGNQGVGIHRIWFRPGEAKAVKKMRLGGSSEPVCIRLWPDAAVKLTLGIAEGVETALAAARKFTPMWSTLDAGQMTKFPLVRGLESLTVFADYDEAGLNASKAVRQRYMGSGCNANFLRPKCPGQDFNDVAMRMAQQ